MKQPKINKDLLELVYPDCKIDYRVVKNTVVKFYIGSIKTPKLEFKSPVEVVHDIKVYISKNFEKYGMDIVQDYHHVEVMKASAMIKEFWDDEDETYYNPQRVFEAFEWIIENCERINEKYSNY